ncbi:uncharacterized protein [Blastocystis hominis]|uniref:Uncharacterized protein n=1 Tax=Blastocystis hominis TaxID=12968 RepID=D8M4B7_BLAHO|nr:uncharacterized protein [Blastocystis hominis]CBK22906.2 unnamed protein product [Blastocystis hominis]|eukprot:XP_012896954.1 uncharacterized protein [Blastocystis hominis]
MNIPTRRSTSRISTGRRRKRRFAGSSIRCRNSNLLRYFKRKNPQEYCEISFIEVDIACFTEQVPGTVSPAEEVHAGFSRGVRFGGAGSRWLCKRKLIFVCSEETVDREE